MSAICKELRGVDLLGCAVSTTLLMFTDSAFIGQTERKHRGNWKLEDQFLLMLILSDAAAMDTQHVLSKKALCIRKLSQLKKARNNWSENAKSRTGLLQQPFPRFVNVKHHSSFEIAQNEP